MNLTPISEVLKALTLPTVLSSNWFVVVALIRFFFVCLFQFVLFLFFFRKKMYYNGLACGP